MIEDPPQCGEAGLPFARAEAEIDNSMNGYGARSSWRTTRTSSTPRLATLICTNVLARSLTPKPSACLNMASAKSLKNSGLRLREEIV